MHYNKVKAKLKRLANNDKLNSTIIRKVKNSFIVYNIYKITNINGLWRVIKHEQVINHFDTSATALSWCVSDYSKQYMVAHHIMFLDRRLQNKKTDVLLRKQFLNNVEDSERKATAVLRITQDVGVCQSLRIEINNILYLTKYKQLQDLIK